MTIAGGSGSADGIVVAAGTSARMAGVDKLLALIEGRPLLAHTLAALAAASEIDSLVVVTSPERRRAIEAGSWLPTLPITFVDGGTRRQDSVRAGFEALERAHPDPAGVRVVLVHDGARPLVSPSLVTAVVHASHAHGAAVPVIPVVETLKRLVGDVIVTTVDRSGLAAAQTPQGARRGLLRTALASAAARQGTWTDEAALLEACNIPVHAVPGDPANIKVTVPTDLVRITDELTRVTTSQRTGIGHDAHPFGPGEPLRLGGVDIVGAPRLHGHSDGDVALHALADALLGAAGLGDLGRLFPADATTTRGVNSQELLAAVVARLAGHDWRTVSVDLTIVAGRPRLSGHLDSMRDVIAAALRLDPSAVSVKASSGNLDGSEGAGRSVSTLAIATIEAMT